MHRFQNLQQAPSPALVPLRVQNAFPLEVYVIDERVTSLRSFRQTSELFLHIGSIRRRRFGQHFRESAFQARQKKFRLQIDRVGEEVA